MSYVDFFHVSCRETPCGQWKYKKNRSKFKGQDIYSLFWLPFCRVKLVHGMGNNCMRNKQLWNQMPKDASTLFSLLAQFFKENDNILCISFFSSSLSGGNLQMAQGPTEGIWNFFRSSISEEESRWDKFWIKFWIRFA